MIAHDKKIDLILAKEREGGLNLAIDEGIIFTPNLAIFAVRIEARVLLHKMMKEGVVEPIRAHLNKEGEIGLMRFEHIAEDLKALFCRGEELFADDGWIVCAKIHHIGAMAPKALFERALKPRREGEAGRVVGR